MRYLIILGIIAILLISGCNKMVDGEPQVIGGDKDEHGCLIAAGYSWCPSTQKCQRMWEEYCAEYAEQYRGNETKKEMTPELCETANGHWNDCGSRCAIDNQGKKGIMCAAVCDEICECSGIAGFGCPSGYQCKMPSGIADAMGYCE